MSDAPLYSDTKQVFSYMDKDRRRAEAGTDQAFENLLETPELNVTVFGHSLGKVDQGILSKLFEKADSVEIEWYSDEDKEGLHGNLQEMLQTDPQAMPKIKFSERKETVVRVLFQEELVSLIVPVYNVSSYIDKCVRSLVNQTYHDLEILLIDDGSTDDSLGKCKAWAKTDPRIRCYHKENEGLGPTRDYGVARAKGRYILFVDSDDWVEPDYVRTLYDAIIAEDADMAECGFYREKVADDERSTEYSGIAFGRRLSKEERMVWGSSVQWNKMFRKEFYQKSQIRQPALPGEDVAVYALEVALAERIATVSRPLYHYQKYRPSAISSRLSTCFAIPRSLQYLVEGFRQHGLSGRYQQPLLHACLRWASRYNHPDSWQARP